MSVQFYAFEKSTYRTGKAFLMRCDLGEYIKPAVVKVTLIGHGSTFQSALKV